MKKLEFKKDAKVQFKGEVFSIRRVLTDFKTVLATNIATGVVVNLPLGEVTAYEEKIEVEQYLPPIDCFSPEEIATARKRYNLIKEIVDKRLPKEELAKIAGKSGVGVSTLYKWRKRYSKTGQLTSLVDRDGRGGGGKSRLNAEVDNIIDDVITQMYFKARNSVNATYREIKHHCREAKLPTPHINTVRNRINVKSGLELASGRRGKSKAEELFEPKVGSIEGAEYPLDLVQIDHTKLDVVLVDEVDREPLGRPWITVLIDVCSRVPIGFYISLDPPGNFGTGYAISNSILPKEKWLAKYGVTGDWPCWGFMKTLHCDNAGEFHSNMLEIAGLEYGISLQFRPKKKPHYGAHIERLLGTFNKDIHDLPGTTFSSSSSRKFLNYDSEKRAAFTLEEIEEWILTYITSVYLIRPHKGLGMSPLQKYGIGIFGAEGKKGIGIPPRPVDELRLRLDLLPFELRTIQRYGVEIGSIKYYSDVLRPWIGYIDPKQPRKSKEKAKFRFKVDPRDLSKVYFLDPKLNEYFPIPYLNVAGPAMSKWEKNRVERLLKDNGKEVSEEAVFQGFRKLKEIQEGAQRKTKQARRDRHRKTQTSKDTNITVAQTRSVPDDTGQIENEFHQILPFDGLDHESFT